MLLSPVILIVYNRPDHTRQTLEALRQNELSEQSDLYIFSDAARSPEQEFNVAGVRKYIRTVSGFKNIFIHEREHNLGLAKNIISSVSQIISQYGRVILLEDDLITSPSFLIYMNQALEKYQKVLPVFSVSAYTPRYLEENALQEHPYDSYFNYRNSSWGWGTWEDRWDKVDWQVTDFSQFAGNKHLQKQFNRGGDDLSDMLIAQQQGKINSWSIRFTYAHFKHDAVSLCPARSLIGNIGFDGSGTNCDTDILMKNDRKREFNHKTDFAFPEEVVVNEKIMKSFRWIYERSIYKRITKKINRYLLSRQ